MAKSRNIGGVNAKLTLDSAGFNNGLKRGEVAAKRFASNMKAVAFGTMLGNVGNKAMDIAIGKAKSLATGTTKAFHRMREAVEQSENTGMATGEVIKLRRAYKDAGRDAEGLGKDVGKMQKSIVTAASGGKDPFAAIGLSANELLKLDPAKQMEDIGDALLKIENPAIRTAAALDIFGKGGIGMISVFDKMEGIRSSMKGVPELANKFGAAMAEADITIGHFPAKMDGFFTGFAAGVVGEVLPGLKNIDKFSFVNLGKSLGDQVSLGFELIKNPTTWQGIADTAIAQMIRVGENMKTGFISAFDAIKAKSTEWIDSLGEQIKALDSKIYNKTIDIVNASISKQKEFAGGIWNKVSNFASHPIENAKAGASMAGDIGSKILGASARGYANYFKGGWGMAGSAAKAYKDTWWNGLTAITSGRAYDKASGAISGAASMIESGMPSMKKIPEYVPKEHPATKSLWEMFKDNLTKNESHDSSSAIAKKAGDEIDKAFKEAADSVLKKQEAAASLTKPLFRGGGEYDMNPNDSVESTDRSRKDWKETQYDVNDWQKRGLSLDGSQTMKAGDKMLPIVQQIKDILNSIARSEKSPAF